MPRIIRGSIVIVLREDGRFFVHQRSLQKDIFAGKWGVGIGGKVEGNESFLQTAQRELREELGVDTAPESPLELLFPFFYFGDGFQLQSQVYLARVANHICTPPPHEEFARWEWLTSAKVDELYDELCPDTQKFWGYFKQHKILSQGF